MSRWLPERWRARPRELLLGGGEAHDLGDGTSHRSFEAWCALNPGVSVRAFLALDLVTEMSVDQALPLDSDSDVLEWARLQLRAHCGDAAAGRACAAWQCGRARGVSVSIGVDPMALRASAEAYRVRLKGLHPGWCRGLEQAWHCCEALHGDQARLVVAEDLRIASIELQDGLLTGVTTAYLDAPSCASLAEWLGAQPFVRTFVVGHGLGSGKVAGASFLPSLYRPATAAWTGRFGGALA